MHSFRIGPRHRAIAYALVIAMVLALVPEFKITLPVHAAAEFSSGAVYIDSQYDGQTIYIKDGVFSVTVNGATNVNLIFGERTETGAVGVTIDRRHATGDQDEANGDEIDNLYYVSQQLGAAGRAQTCPLLITGNSTVTATFHGECRFYAGTNACTVDGSDKYTASTGGGNGFAGIQVDSGSSLTIDGADDLRVFGGHQYNIPDDDGYITEGTTKYFYSDVLRANLTISGTYTDPYGEQWGQPDGATTNSYTGGAGIGGGPELTPSSSGVATFTNGAPGTIIINGGSVEAYGGHQAAGIGGAVNSPATTNMIQINGGTVVAHGGRWAAGIGDGDTVKKENNNAPSSTFQTANSLIEINGGAVTAYGGVAASGIGTSDRLSDSEGFGASFVRNIQVNLNGGTIRAYSGFPDGYQSNHTVSNAPAAIGAGMNSMAPGNAVYVSSNADLRSAGFGHYAVSENGLNENLPTIAVDSDGYLLLLKTADYYSSQERSLKVYLPLKKTMMVDKNKDNTPETELETYIYTNQQTGAIYYVAFVDDENGTEQKLVFDANGYQVTTAENLTLYVNTNPDDDIPDSTELSDLMIEFPYFFRSVALTLPDPEEFGGIYALAVPTNGVSSGVNKPANNAPIILTVDAREQGTQNGTITYPSDNNLNSRPVSVSLIDLDVNGDDITPGLIGNNFYPTVYGYTVYVEPTTTMVDLYLKFTTRPGVTYQLTYDGTTTYYDGDGNDVVWTKDDIPLTGKETILRIQKKDVDGSTNPDPISYKVTIIVKGDYSLTISAPDKTYDGRPADVSATGVVQYPLIYEPKDVPGSTATVTYTPEKPQPYSYTGSVYISRSGRWSWNYTYYAANLSYQLQIIPDGNYIYYILTFDAPTSANTSSLSDNGTKYAAGWLVEQNTTNAATRLDAAPDVFADTGYDWITGTGDASRTLASGKSGNNATNTVNLTLYVTSTGATLSSGGTLLTLAKPTSSSSNTNVASSEAKDSALDAIRNGETSGSFPYEVSNTIDYSQNITVNTFTWQANTENTSSTPNSFPYNISGTTTYTEKGSWVIVGKPDTSKESTPVKVPAEDLENVVYTYYRTHDAAGKELGAPELLGVLAEPPKDAGTYRVEASLVMLTYNANGTKTFKIEQRPVTVLRITNWLVYVDTAPTTATLAIPNPGDVELDNLIQGDDVKLLVDAAGGKVYYDDPDSDTLAVDYKSDKIVLAQATLDGNQAHNYKLVYTDEPNQIIRVYGQIAYEVNGTIFRKDEGAEADWRKYYPVDSEDPVGGGTAPDYHSPPETNTEHGTYLTHAEYIRARTVNQGEDEARYCIDIEYGAMSFGFFRSIWDVNDLVYDETNTSRWTGMDGSNNKLTIINYSNRPVEYTLSLTRDTRYGDKIDFVIKTTNVTTGGDPLVSMTGTTMSAESGKYEVAAATAGSGVGASGEEARTSSYVILSGVPQFADGINPSVGIIGISFSPASDDS